MGQQTSVPKITAQDRAIFQLKQQRDKLKVYQRKLESIVARQNNLAKEAIGNKEMERAKFYLRSKKQQQKIISTTYEQLDNLENLIGTIEFKLIEKDVVYGLQQGNEVLRKLNSEMSVEKIDKVLDDLEEHRINVEEVGDMIGMGSGLSNRDENEVEEELLRLGAEVGNDDKVVATDLATSSSDIQLPQVPQGKLEELEVEPEREPVRKTTEQAELAA